MPLLPCSARSRGFRLVSLLAVVLTVPACSDSGGRNAARDAEVREQQALLSGFLATAADTSSIRAAVPEVGPMPASAEARALWLRRRILAESRVRSREIAARHGIDLAQPPAAWITPEYVAHASAHPEVGRFLAGYAEYCDEMRSTQGEWADTRLRRIAAEAELSAAKTQELASGFASTARLDDRRWESNQALAAASLELHRFLVSVDRRVDYDPERRNALFHRDEDLKEFQRLTHAMEVLNLGVREEETRHATLLRMESESLQKDGR